MSERILLVDDHAVVRRGTRDIIRSLRPDSVFAEAGDAAMARRLLREWSFTLAVVDISLPDGSGLDLLAWIVPAWPELPVLVLSMHHEAEYARRAMSLGARGYLGKNCPPEELSEALAGILEGGTYVSPGLSFAPRPSAVSSALSAREREVMHGLASGRSLSEIAVGMDLSVKTASTYRTRAMRKLGLRTQAEFFRHVLEHGDLFA